MPRPAKVKARRFGLQQYQPVFEQMQAWSASRNSESPDEFWLMEHYPVYTQGRNGKPEHVLSPGNIPVVQVDRGGQVTYHGPGQLMVYLMLDVRRGGWGVREIVSAMEHAVIRLLKDYGIEAYADNKAPGVYVEGDKISALGLRVRNGRSYHGLSLNLDMDLSPFDGINPCGYAGLRVVCLAQLAKFERERLEKRLCEYLAEELGIGSVEFAVQESEIEMQ